MLRCHRVRSWALCRLQTHGCQSCSRRAGSPDAGSAALGGPPLPCLCGLRCLRALQRNIAWKNGTRVVTLTWQAPFQALHKDLCAGMRHSSAEAGCHDGKGGWGRVMAWAARPVLAEHIPGGPEMLHSVLGSHLAKRAGNLDDLELLWSPVLDDFPLPAAPLLA